MTPLQQIAMGLLLVVLDTGSADGSPTWDLLPDWAGWALLLPAARLLPPDGRGAVLGAGVVAAAISVATWPPAWREVVDGVDPSLDWALLLVPDLVVGALLCRALARAARAGDDGRAARTASVLGAVLVLLAAAPVPFLATGRPVPGDLGLALQVTWLVLLVQLFRWHRKSWAPLRSGPPSTDTSAGSARTP